MWLVGKFGKFGKLCAIHQTIRMVWPPNLSSPRVNSPPKFTPAKLSVYAVTAYVQLNNYVHNFVLQLCIYVYLCNSVNKNYSVHVMPKQ